jgi:hypothetical protein
VDLVVVETELLLVELLGVMEQRIQVLLVEELLIQVLALEIMVELVDQA